MTVDLSVPSSVPLVSELEGGSCSPVPLDWTDHSMAAEFESLGELTALQIHSWYAYRSVRVCVNVCLCVKVCVCTHVCVWDQQSYMACVCGCVS